MKKIDVLLVDDEISAINTLRGMLNQYFPLVNVIGHANSVDEALLKVQQEEPDLVFLDIEMPPFGSGFDFLQSCQPRRFGVIFVTAYPQYAVKAINDVQPWAYLVKPYSVSDLINAVQIATEKIQQEKLKTLEIPEMLSIIVADSRKGNIVIRVRDILYCQADNTTSDIFFLKEGKVSRITAYRTLKDMQEQLPDSHFFRCHNSYLVNLSFVERYEKTGRNGMIHLSTGENVPISVAKMEEFEEEFSNYLLLR